MKRFDESKFRIIDTNKPLNELGEFDSGVYFLPENECFIDEIPNTKGDMRNVLIIGVNVSSMYKVSNFCTYDVFIKNIIFKQINKTGKVLDKNIFFVRTFKYHGSDNKKSYAYDKACATHGIEKRLLNSTMFAIWYDCILERIAYHAAKSYGESIYYGNNSFSDRTLGVLYQNPYWKLHYGGVKAKCIIDEYNSQKYHKAYKYFGELEIDTTPDQPLTQEEKEICKSYCAIMSGVNMLRLKDLSSMKTEYLTDRHIREYYIVKRLQQYQHEVGIDYLN